MALNEFITACDKCGGSGIKSTLIFWKKEPCEICGGAGLIPNDRRINDFVFKELEMANKFQIGGYLPRIEAGIAAMNKLLQNNYYADGGRATMYYYRGLVLMDVAEERKDPTLHLEAMRSLKIADQLGHGMTLLSVLPTMLKRIRSYYDDYSPEQRANAERDYFKKQPDEKTLPL